MGKVMIKKTIIFFYFFALGFSQEPTGQVVLETSTVMNIPMMGSITTKATSYASKKHFKKENQIEIDKFYTRMMFGGNKENGIILNGEKKVRVVFDLDEGEYVNEDFESIIKNNGVPKTKDITNPFQRGGESDDSEEESDDSEEESDERAEENNFKIVERIITPAMESINGFNARKVLTTFARQSGSKMIISEWISTDTLLISFVLEKEKELIESYNGKLSANGSMASMSSDRMIKSIDPSYEFDIVPGKVIKTQMENLNDEGKPSFGIAWEVVSARKLQFNDKDFKVSSKLKKVDQFD